MSNANQYKQFDPNDSSAPALVSVLVNKLLAKKESIDGSERFGDIEKAIESCAERRGDFSMLIYVDGSAQIDKAAKERPNMPIANILAEAVIAEFSALPKGARERITTRFTAICDAVRAVNNANEKDPLPIKNHDKLMTLADTVAPELAAPARERLREREKSPSVRTTGSAYILNAELAGGHVDEAISPGGHSVGVLADLILRNPELGKTLQHTRSTLKKLVAGHRAAMSR
jgi:hypothetical protein